MQQISISDPVADMKIHGVRAADGAKVQIQFFHGVGRMHPHSEIVLPFQDFKLWHGLRIQADGSNELARLHRGAGRKNEIRDLFVGIMVGQARGLAELYS